MWSRRLLPMILLFSIAVHAQARADGPAVVATIAPVHGILAAVMEGSGHEPALLLPGQTSPHLARLRPSQAAMLEDADLIVRIGPDLETFLDHLLDAPENAARVLTLEDLPGIVRHEGRRAGAFETGVIVHDDHGMTSDHDNGYEDHDHDGLDPHIWLDPENGRVMAVAMADRLALLDPAHAETYRANAAALGKRLDGTEQAIDAMLAPVRHRRYLVLHDAYSGFEGRFGLSPVGAFSVAPERPPGSRRVEELRHIVSSGDIACVFTEPQLDPAWVEAILAENSVNKGVLDPLGMTLPTGVEFYPALLMNLAISLHDCLRP